MLYCPLQKQNNNKNRKEKEKKHTFFLTLSVFLSLCRMNCPPYPLRCSNWVRISGFTIHKECRTLSRIVTLLCLLFFSFSSSSSFFFSVLLSKKSAFISSSVQLIFVAMDRLQGLRCWSKGWKGSGCRTSLMITYRKYKTSFCCC